MHLVKRFIGTLILLLLCLCANAQKDFEGIARFDKAVYDFGKISMAKGPRSCRFSVTNISDKPINIFAVLTTCGCTSVNWTRTDIAPGQSGTVDATYSNDEEKGPFDKTLKVYISDIKKPMVLHFKGESVK